MFIWVKRKDRGTIAIYAGHIRRMRNLAAAGMPGMSVKKKVAQRPGGTIKKIRSTGKRRLN